MNSALPLNLETRMERLRLSWALVALGIMVLPQALHLAPWVIAVALLIALWRLAAAYRGWPLFNRYLRLGLGLAAFLGVYLTYRTLNGPEAGTALLILLATLKLMEAKGLRDYFLLLVIALFIGIANFLYDQTIPLALYMVPAVWLATAALLNVAHPDVTRPPMAAMKTAAKLLLPALPVAVVLFLLFPRVPGPLWGIGLPQHSGVTGLSTHMAPGSISELAASDAIAFRVKFSGGAPPPAQLYWRALVLHDYDGRSWSIGDVPWAGHAQLISRGMPVRYEVTLEPNDLRVLYTLDLPVEIPADARLTADHEVIVPQMVTERKRYSVVSYTDSNYGAGASAWMRDRDLLLPQRIDPHARALAQQWKAAAESPQQIVQDALRMFHDQPFSYTLQPGKLTGRNQIDQFLFDTRRGFCEHYAGAFVFLMRAAGVPAHVVIGYQGGTRNPLDGYYSVRQEDAHAWAEVWLADRGWVRVDPTAAVDPARVDEGLAAALPASEVPGYLFRAHPWLGEIRNTWDAANNGWNQWVLAYGPALQQRFYARLGLQYGNWLQLALVLLLLIGGLLALVWLVLIWRHRPPRSPAVDRQYRRFCQRLARRGLARKPYEGPFDYAERVGRSRPEWHAQVRAITSLYAALRYSGTGNPQEFSRLVAAFHP
ncbi:MAG: DUF3488 domain-containing transglutaminase family protein [Gammaproteobacteria bacterium]|nr:DUF3488 domain-containing transglutaminase family protein [Gammaproteobacteria bacterium]